MSLRSSSSVKTRTWYIPSVRVIGRNSSKSKFAYSTVKCTVGWAWEINITFSTSEWFVKSRGKPTWTKMGCERTWSLRRYLAQSFQFSYAPRLSAAATIQQEARHSPFLFGFFFLQQKKNATTFSIDFALFLNESHCVCIFPANQATVNLISTKLFSNYPKIRKDNVW